MDDQVDTTSSAAVTADDGQGTAGAAERTKSAPPKQEPEAADAVRDASSGATLMATGRRKSSVARVRLMPGAGSIMVNRRPYDQYFPREALRLAIRSPLLATHQLGKYNVVVSVIGGGLTGQAGAIRLGIARALCEFNVELRPRLKKDGLLTRDARAKERKKYGMAGARKRFQFSKR